MSFLFFRILDYTTPSLQMRTLKQSCCVRSNADTKNSAGAARSGHRAGLGMGRKEKVGIRPLRTLVHEVFGGQIE